MEQLEEAKTAPTAGGEKANSRTRSIRVSVPEPSQRRVKDGKIQPFSRRSRSSSGSVSNISSKRTRKDVWREAELYLTDMSLCYKIEGMGVSIKPLLWLKFNELLFAQVCEFLLEDLLGVQISQDPPACDPRACEFTVHLYTLINPEAERIVPIKCTNRIRVRSTVTILFSAGEKFADNLQSAREWKTAVLLQTNRAVKAAFCDANGEEESKSECKHLQYRDKTR